MPYLGWASFGGMEIISNSRAAAYSKGLSVLCQCDTLPEALGDAPYRSPAEDPAPWYERTVPESAEFWGVIGLEIHGASQTTLSRTWTDLIEDGAVSGAGRRAARELEFKVMLIGGTEAGLSYGISWLAAALRGAACHTGFGGDRLCLLAGCPEPPPAGHEHEDPCNPTRPNPAPERDRTTPPAPPEPAPASAAQNTHPRSEPVWPPADPGPPPRGGRIGPPDPAVMRTIFLVGKEMRANNKVMLSAFECGLVESQMSNLNWGDADSVGAFQQRPSQGWGTPEQCMNVNYAAHKFFEKAIPGDAKDPGQSPGKLAQSVQRSAHPERYDQREAEAIRLIDDTFHRIQGENPPPPPPPPEPAPPPEPEPEPVPPPDNNPIPPPDPSPPDDDTDQWGRWDAHRAADDLIRMIYDVALAEFADDEERARVSGAWTATLTFTLKAGNPAWFAQPVTFIDARKPDQYAQPAVRDVLPDYRIDTVADCPQPVDCLAASPYMAAKGPWGDEPFPGSNPADPAWRDPGYPTRPFTAARDIYTVPGDITPGWFERVPIIELYSGKQDLHRITVRFHENPRNKTVTTLDPCDALNEITLPWVPARTRVTLDGRTREVEVKCPDGNVLTSDVVLYGPLGTLLEWPVFDCGTPMILEMLAQNSTIATDSWWRVQWAAKTDAI